ncbi:MAG TPA: LPS export ABC transporter periplasmic protein LptC [Syntrophaceae bacterium]|jgi:LPS export ABC transporter protein LptC|nr:LPS export ABC transporter periplasmic protein LptC [Syntrophaceae bacterium]
MKFKQKTFIVTIAIAIVVSAVVVFLVMKNNNSSQGKLLQIMSDNVDLQVKNVNYTDVGDSGLKWEVKADSANYIKSENIAILDKIRVKLVMSDGKILMMTGDKGKLHTDTKDMEISGNVEIISDKGDRLTTDVLKYSDSERRIYTEEAVKMENARMQVRGVGMSFSLVDKDVTLLSKVKANIR